MNAALHTTFADLTRALTPAPVLTAADFAASEMKREGGRRLVEWKLSIWGMQYIAEQPLPALKSRVQRKADMQADAIKRKHWTGDVNRLVAMSEMLERIEQFQRRGA